MTVVFHGADLHAEGGLAAVVQCENRRCKLLFFKKFLNECKALLIVLRKQWRDDVGGNGDGQRLVMFVCRRKTA